MSADDQRAADIKALVDKAPPLTSEQLSHLRTLFDDAAPQHDSVAS